LKAHIGTGGAVRSRDLASGSMSAGLARNWWAVGLRGISAIAFVGILALPRPTLASLILGFSAYIAADGIFAIVSGVRALRRSERWRGLILEGSANLAVAGAALAIPDLTIIPFVRLTSAWAVVTGALGLAAARRLVNGYGRWLLVLSGGMSIVWGVLEGAAGPSSDSDATEMELWLVAYAIPFGLLLLALSWRLQFRQSAHASA
jgi:uncharacterized membrane protein HdeD (DUF308 family)